LRKSRVGEVTCNCKAYKFPHRFSGGKCTGHHLAESAYYEGDTTCASCPEYSEHGCAVVDGRESIELCEVFIDFTERNEIKLK
jgi:hypothetical protein